MHDRCPICIYIVALISRSTTENEKVRLRELLAKHRRRKANCNSLIRIVKSCVLPFSNGITLDPREVKDFYKKPADIMDLNQLNLLRVYEHY